MSQTRQQPGMGTDSRPRTLHVSRSFTRMDNTPSPMSSPRKRASTLQEAGIPSIPEARHIETSPELSGRKPMADVFENNEEDEHIEGDEGSKGPALNVPSTFDELPIEIKSLCERFLDSLSAKVHPTPLSADQLSELFQDFYERASQHIATHIATLSSRIGRDTPPASSASSSSRKQLGRARAGSGAKKASSDDLAGSVGGEMLTASEVADRKKARKLLEHKRVALEEAVERGVCEKVYDKIWKHRSADDDARDEKLRSRTAALSLVGIGLKELHMDQDPAKADVRKTAEEKEDEIYQSLASAREALIHMDDDHYPLGKLQHLTAAHKSIVETLSQLFPSSSSADEILPTLIYTLITCPQEGINVVSNLNFIQRFRTVSKVDGEAAYCLVNLEAAISFLETVDLSSLRADELPQGPAKSHSRPVTPVGGEKPPPSPRPAVARTLTPSISPMNANSSDQSTPSTTAKAALPSPSSPNPSARPGMHQRRISGLMQAQLDRIEAGKDNFLNAADQFYDSVNGTLDNSLQFLFGRFKEQVAANDSALPKTLEEARKLVSSPSTGEDDDSLSVSGRSSPGLDDPLSAANKPSTTDNKVLELLGGRKQLRDRSVDSARSGGSGNSRRVTFDSKTGAGIVNNGQRDQKPDQSPAASQGNLFASINPLNRFGMPNFPRFGRAGTMPTPSPPAEKPTPNNTPSAAAARLSDIVESPATALKPGSSEADFDAALEKTRSRESSTVSEPLDAEDDDLNAREALAALRKLKGPKRRFLDAKSANELRVGEVEELLLEYKRLAKALADAISG